MRTRPLAIVVLAAALAALLLSNDTQAETVPVTRGNFTYYFDVPQYIDQADSTLRAARRRLQTLLRSDLDFQAEIFLTDSEERFDSLLGGQFPDWGAAAAIPALKRIVLRAPGSSSVSRPFAELLSHEYSHLALGYRTGLNEAPRWFDEGLAMIVSMQWAWEDNLTLNFASVSGQFIPLDEIDMVNRFGESKARLAYGESYMAVQYFFDNYGIDGVNEFIDQIGRGASLDEALMASTGSNYRDFDEEIRVYLRQRFNFVGLMADMMYFWLALAIIVIIGFVLMLRKKRQYYRKWEDEEKLASTDFDYGDPDDPEKTDDDEEPWRR
jgi:hypothetical protein